MAARMLNSRARRLKLIRSTARARKTPTWKATQNQMLVDTAQTVPCSALGRNRKALEFPIPALARNPDPDLFCVRRLRPGSGARL